MKKLFLLLLMAGGSLQNFAQTLFSFGNTAVDKEEFLRAYNKNQPAVVDKEKSIREYLNLYIKFKLKVKAARDIRLDTLPQLINDLESFKSQIEEAYMNNESALNGLVEEAFTRSQKDIHVIHFYIPLADDLKTADSLMAYKAMEEVNALMRSDNNDYEKVSKTLTNKYGKITGNDLGFITAFSLPYEYENIVYGLTPGETSKAYRSAKGLHLFKVLEERKAAGKWKIAQILFAMPPGDDPANSIAIKKKADSVYNLLKQGKDFAGLAKDFSDDKMSYMTGGEMPEFGTGKFEYLFEKEVFKLKNEGDFCQPFATQFGYHIVKKLKQTPTPADKENTTYLQELKQRVLQDSRVNKAKEIFMQDVFNKIGFKKNATIKESELFRFADTITANLSADISKKIPVYDKVIFTVGKTNIKGADWLAFIREYKNTPEMYKGETNANLYEKFIRTSALNYYKKNLEDYNPDFKYQMNEFRDGNILFEIMERNIWSYAANDTIGLQKYYNLNKSKYLWQASANIIIFNCGNVATAEQTIASIKSGKDWKKIMEENSTVHADSGRYEISQIPIAPDAKPATGYLSSPLTNSIDGSASFVKFIKLYDANVQRSFDEARGLVINDYQNILEDKWVADLKIKYNVKINEEVFMSLLK